MEYWSKRMLGLKRHEKIQKIGLEFVLSTIVTVKFVNFFVSTERVNSVGKIKKKQAHNIWQYAYML